MATFGVTYKITRSFFDRASVQKKVGRARAKVLSKFGAFVRTNARRKQLRTRKGTSKPYNPPNVHSRNKVDNLKNILFGLDSDGETVVIGPVRLNQKQYMYGVPTTGTVPQVMEFGGTVGLREKLVGSQWRPKGRRKPRPDQPTRVRKVKYLPRPFMTPAFKEEMPKFPPIWADIIAA